MSADQVPETTDGVLPIQKQQEKNDRLLELQKEVLERIVQGEPLNETLEALCQIVEQQSDNPLVATVLMLDPDGIHLRAAAGKSSPPEWTAAIDPLKIGPAVGSCGTAAYRGERVIVSDIDTDPLWEPYREFALRFGFRACWSTPILSSSGRVLGTFAIYYRQARDPDPQDLRIVDVLTRTAGIGIERKLAEQALALQNSRLKLLWETAGVLLSTDEPGPMLNAVFEKLRYSLELDVYVNYAVTRPGQSLQLISHAGFSEQETELIAKFDSEQAMRGLAAKHSEMLVAGDIQHSEAPEFATARKLGIRAIICSPLLVGERLLGTLAFGSRSKDRFESDESEYLQTICRYVAAAYERLDLIGQLREQDQRKDEFLAMLAHELRNPLAPIRSGLELLALEPPGEHTDSVALMQEQVEHLVRLVDDLLDVSRIMQGKVELRHEPVELCDLVVRALQAMESAIEERRHELRVSLPNQQIWANADPVRLIQVLENLVTNAAKYTDVGGKIEVAVECVHPCATISVTDNGVGIEPELLPKVFDLFTQSTRALDRSQGGLGIGLTLVQRLITMHDGRVIAESEGIGKGSTFRILLPTIKDQVRPETPGPDSSARRGPFRILVVDDNRAASHLLARLLGKLGNHEIRTADDGEMALRMVTQFDPEIVLLDIGLPGLSGYEVARKIRELPAHERSLLIALTGYGQEEDRRKSLEAGFDEHLVKPPSLDQMKLVLGHPKLDEIA